MPSFLPEITRTLFASASLSLAQASGDPPTRVWGVVLLVALAGFVFLFLQNRRVLANQESLLVRSKAIARRIGALEDRFAAIAAEPPPPEGLEDPGLDRLETLAERFSGMVERLDAMGADLNRIEEGQSHLAGAMRSAAARPEIEEAPRVEEPTEPRHLAREYLLAEGYSRVEFLREEPAENGVRILLRGMIGDELRAGHLRLDGGRVVECNLDVPTSLFP